MKKLFLTIGCVALLGMGVVAVSCSKEDEAEKGKKDAKAFCDCWNKLEASSSEADIEKCEAIAEKAEKNTNKDYVTAYTQEALKCLSFDF